MPSDWIPGGTLASGICESPLPEGGDSRPTLPCLANARGSARANSDCRDTESHSLP